MIVVKPPPASTRPVRDYIELDDYGTFDSTVTVTPMTMVEIPFEEPERETETVIQPSLNDQAVDDGVYEVPIERATVRFNPNIQTRIPKANSLQPYPSRMQ